jgi:hypothetical protein
MCGFVEDHKFAGFLEDFSVPRIDIYDDDPITRLFVTRHQPRCNRRHYRRSEGIIEITDEVRFRRLERGRIAVDAADRAASRQIGRKAGDILQRDLVKLARELDPDDLLNGRLAATNKTLPFPEP